MKKTMQKIWHSMMRYGGKRTISMAMILSMLLSSLPISALADRIVVDEDGTITITDDDGNVQVVDESWEETFPYGTFALSHSELEGTEGDELALTVYRLGGTQGKATAWVEYNPIVPLSDVGVADFVYAAGWEDLSLLVEDPSPLARYQAIGAPKRHIQAADKYILCDPSRTTNNTESSPGVVRTYGDYCMYVPDVQADSYTWQVQKAYGEPWEDVLNYSENHLIVSNKMYFDLAYEYRCIYTVGDKTYCTRTAYMGDMYVEEPAEVLEPVPENLYIPDAPVYTEVSQAENGFEAYEKVEFPVTFAEGEWQKTIRIQSVDDDVIEGSEFGTFTISRNEGGTLYESANKCILQLVDNEEKAPTTLSMDVEETTFDRAGKQAVIHVTREGDTTYPITIDYTIGAAGDTAIEGQHYAHTAGTLYFYGDSVTQKLVIPLISGEEADEIGKSLTVTLGELKGGMKENLASLVGTDTLCLTLTDSGTKPGESMNLSTLLAGGDGVDVSGAVGEAEAVSSPLGAVTGEAEDQNTIEPLTAEVVWNDPRLRTYQYNGGAATLSFSRGGDRDYLKSYWGEWENIVNGEKMDKNADISSVAGYGALGSWDLDNMYDEYDKDKAPNGAYMKLDKNATGLRLNANSMMSAELTIADGVILFDKVEGAVYYQNFNYGQHEKSKPLYLANAFHLAAAGYDELDDDWNGEPHYSTITEFFVRDPSMDDANRNHSFSADWSGMTREIHRILGIGKIRTELNLELALYPVLYRKELKNGSPQNDSDLVLNDITNGEAGAEYYLTRGRLRRQYFTKDLALTVYTANDVDVLDEGTKYARLDYTDPAKVQDVTDLYNSIKPVVTVVSGKGGVTRSGRLFVGSTIQVALTASGGYTISEELDMGETGYSVYLTDSQNNIIQKATYEGQDENGSPLFQLEMFWDEMKEAEDQQPYKDEQYTLHVVMDRQQRIIVDVSPSMYKVENGEIVPADYETAVRYFLDSHPASSSGVMGTQFAVVDKNADNLFTKDHDRFFKVDVDGAEDDWLLNYSRLKNNNGEEENAMLLELQGTTQSNLYSINFDLPAEDKIAFNGRVYNGDQEIILQFSDLARRDLRFYYYKSEFVSVPNTIEANLIEATLYLDGNGNGKIEGQLNESTGTFILPENSADKIITTFKGENLLELDERYAEPVALTNGGRAGYILKVWYSMNPRKLIPDASDDQDLTATIQPAFTTAITDPAQLQSLNEAEKAYRYLIAGKTDRPASADEYAALERDVDSAQGRPIYGGLATKNYYVDIPLGGDYTPATLVWAKGGQAQDGDDDYLIYQWEPTYWGKDKGTAGNMLYPYEAGKAIPLEPIRLANTVVGKNLPIAEPESVKADNGVYTYTYTDTDIANMNGYLSSFVGTTTYNLSVIAPVANEEDDTHVESVTRGNLQTHPNSEYLKTMNGDTSDMGKVDMDDSKSEFPEFNSDFTSKLGSTNLNVSDYMSIIVDGYNVGFSVGIPLAGYHSNGDAGAGGAGAAAGGGSGESYGPKDANAARGSEIADLFNYFKNKKQGTPGTNLGAVDDSYRAAKHPDSGQPPKHSAKGFGVELSVKLVMLFTWNPLDNGYYFSSMTVGVSGNATFTVMYRLTVCPLVYGYLKLGAGLDVTTGIGVARDTKRASSPVVNLASDTDVHMDYRKDDPYKLKQGEVIIFETDRRAFDIEFNGKLMVEVGTYEDDVFEPMKQTTEGKAFRTGAITSAAERSTTVTLVEKSGMGIDDDNNTYYVRLTAVKDTDIIEIYEAIDVRTKVYWTGVTLEPSAYLEVGAGIGVELMKVELYVSANIALSATIGAYDVPTETYKGGEFNSFSFSIGLSLRVVAVVFNFDFDMARYTVTYADKNDGNGKVWTHTFKAGGGAHDKDFKPKAQAVYSGSDGVTDVISPMVTISLPESAANTQTLYTPVNENMKALQPTSAAVPFELSAYGTSADAFRLGDGLAARSEQQILTVGEDQYLLYTYSRSDVESHHETMLVLSKIRVTSRTGSADNYGLVNPVDETSETPYIIVDDDGTGDLSFHGWVDTNNVIHAAWVSYAVNASATMDANGDGNIMAEEEIAYQTALAKQVQVKTASFDTTGETGFTTPTVISDAQTNAYRYLPSMEDGAIFYAESVHYDDSELTTVNNRYWDYLDIVYNIPTTTTDPDTAAASQAIHDFLLVNRMADNGLYGKQSKLHMWVNGVASSMALTEGEMLGNVEFAATGTNTWTVAYTTTQTKYYDHVSGGTVMDNTELNTIQNDKLDEVKIQRLYLRKVTLVDGAIQWGTPVVLRVLLDMDQDNTADGRYVNNAKTVDYEDPTFSNLRFLYAKLGNSLTGGEEVSSYENYTKQTGTTVDPENFLLFDMMGSTYVIPEDDLNAILGGSTNATTGLIYPFFVPETVTTVASDGTEAETDRGQNTANTATGRMEVVIGADAEGNLAAVYTSPMESTGNNGLYISWYDSTVSKWGQGKLLAMNHLQVYEDSLKYYLTPEEQKKAYLGRQTGVTEYDTYVEAAVTEAAAGGKTAMAKGEMDNFTFSDLELALGRTNDKPTILIMARGTMTNLTYLDIRETTYDPIDAAGMDDIEAELVAVDSDAKALNEALLNYTLTPVRKGANDEGINPFTIENSDVGFYGITVGAGTQDIGRASMTLADYTFSAGDLLQSYVAFTNTGDTAIRGSETEPITVTLNAKKPDGTIVPIASWTIEDSILAGQEVALFNEGDKAHKLETSLPDGTEFYLHVTEYENFNTNAFNKDSEVLFTVAEKVELGFEKLEITTAGLDDNGNTILHVEGTIANRGNKDANGVFVQFAYQTGDNGEEGHPNPVYTPVDLTGHEITVSKQEPISMDTRTVGKTDLQKGILRMRALGDNAADFDKIGSNMLRTFSGTFTVPADAYYAQDEAKALHLKLEIFCTESGYSEQSSDSIVTSEHTAEYKATNNARTLTIAPKTWFNMPGNVVMAMGNTMRLAVDASSTVKHTGADAAAGDTSGLYVQETSNGETGWTPNLGILYYNHADKTIVIAPEKEGTGFIRLADKNTGSFTLIAYTVTEKDLGLNIDEENEIFQFSGDEDKSDWEFQSVMTGNGETVPYLNDLSVATKEGATVTYTTVARGIDLYMLGSATVTVTNAKGTVLAEKKLYSEGIGSDDKKAVYWSNPERETVTVTITAASGTGLDRLVEYFAGTGVPTPADDNESPQIFWSRSLPDTASIEAENGAAVTPGMFVYAIDNGTIASITLNGDPVTETRITDNFWKFPVDITENGTVTVSVTDASGKVTTRNVIVDWFNSTVTQGAVSWAPAAPAYTFKDAAGSDMQNGAKGTHYLHVTAPTGMPESLTGYTFTTTAEVYNPADATFGNITADEEKTTAVETVFPVSANGYYRIRYTASSSDENQPDVYWNSVIASLDKFAADSIQMILTWDENAPNQLSYTVEGTSDLKNVSINGKQVTELSGTYPVTYNGTYTLYADYGDSSTGMSSTVTVTGLPITLAYENGLSMAYASVHPWNQTEDNGLIAVYKAAFKGGYYDTSLDIASGQYYGLYQFSVVEEDQPAPTDAEHWITIESAKWDATISGLTPGSYTLYVRDSQEPTNVWTCPNPIVLEGQRTVMTVTTTPVSNGNAADGTITVTGSGGIEPSEGYEYTYVSIDGTYDAGTNAADIPLATVENLSNWTYAANGYTIANLSEGWYQVAVRNKSQKYDTDSDNKWDNAATAAVYVGTRSSDTTLESLHSSLPLNQDFVASVREYSADVLYNRDSITISARPNVAKATVSLNGTSFTSALNQETLPLTVGTNTITITVEAEDQVTTGTYTITINRGEASTDATLSALLQDSEYDFNEPFDPDRTEYTMEVPYAVSEITVTPVTSNAFADAASVTQQLEVGDNEVTIVVTAENGDTRTYTIHIHRADTLLNQYFGYVMENWVEDLAAGYDWLELSKRIPRANHGRTFNVDPGSSLEMPGYILDAMAKAHVTLKIKAGTGVNWILESDLVAGERDNLGMHLGAALGGNWIGSELAQSVAGENWHIQLQLTQSQRPDVAAKLETDLGTAQAGKEAHLFWLDEEGELVYLTDTVVNAKGMAIWEMPEEIGGKYLIVTGFLTE